MEKALVDIWRQLFDGEIGTDENYFELGAHSLMLVRAHERISATIKPDLPIAALFQYPTVRDLAAHLDGGHRAGPARRRHPGARAEPAARRGTAQGTG